MSDNHIFSKWQPGNFFYHFMYHLVELQTKVSLMSLEVRVNIVNVFLGHLIRQLDNLDVTFIPPFSVSHLLKQVQKVYF